MFTIASYLKLSIPKMCCVRLQNRLNLHQVWLDCQQKWHGWKKKKTRFCSESTWFVPYSTRLSAKSTWLKKNDPMPKYWLHCGKKRLHVQHATWLHQIDHTHWACAVTQCKPLSFFCFYFVFTWHEQELRIRQLACLGLYGTLNATKIRKSSSEFRKSIFVLPKSIIVLSKSIVVLPRLVSRVSKIDDWI